MSSEQSNDQKTTQATKKKRPLHTFTIKETKFIIDQKYKPIRALGAGAYGQVM